MKQGKNAAPRASARNYHSGPESEAEAADIRCAAIDERRAVLTAPSRSVDAQKPEPSVERLGALDLRRVLQPASATTTTPPGLRRPPLAAQGSSSKLPKGRKARSGDVKVQLGSLTPARPPWLGVDFESEYEERRKFDFKNSDIEESDFRGSEDIEDGEARAPPGLAARSAMHRASLFWNTYLSNLAHQYLATFPGGGGGAVARRSAAFADEILHLANNVGLQEEVEARAGLAGLSAAGAAGGGSTGKEESGESDSPIRNVGVVTH
ncbi:hypothetical protein EMIHUDRAFT_208978 [Emiliania huxleyi CCMP1516]|uniref:Uncharacterized protein n=2 Tax=Emiliania huxleyi TaxID=2903 RepID=A0A0D3J7G2_EMIH1|nr:hypothetical protein EMIHUDRAFT_208978 [Emiliania huxleyi CCMP1516]EOD19447.1 hypothetical protein EMIHUDRAFT_208978 [Emiliania huxleyi CCMP1516]|eukprot:XP_005771876.1 hypothetical protein EMIHUDRAFT_208978 [Emiliania huxleyi CCMP1516]